MMAKQVYGAAIAFAIVGLMANVARAAEGDRLVYGAGMETCAVWQKSRSGNRVAELQLQAWIDGFFSGYNAASEGTDFLMPRPETVAYYAWIDKHCGQNPLNKVMQAAVALKDELTARARH
jgi:hypothetical protein